MYKKLLAATCCAVFGTAISVTQVISEPVEVAIVHFNDLDRMGERGGQGGVARLASIIDSVREDNDNVLVTFGGDTISPSLMSALDKGAHMIDLLNQLGLTAMVVGNHEFDFGPEIAVERIADAEFPILSANAVNPDGDLLEGTTDSLMVNIGDYQIGIMGLTTVGTAVKSSPGEFSFLDPVEVADRLSGALREAGADLVIILGHTDDGEDEQLMAQGAADIILSGDDHKLVSEYSDGTLFVESGEQADHVTVVNLAFDREDDDGEMKFVWGFGVEILDSGRFEPNEELMAAVSAYEGALDEELSVELGTTETELDSRRETIRGKEAAIANLFADAIREATNADISIMNGGGIRANRTYDPGTVLTRRDIQSELPFGNKTVLIEVTGQDVIDALENGFSEYENGAGRFPHVSGVSVTVDLSQPGGSRIVEVSRDGSPIDPEANFTLAVNNYVAGGGDGYSVFEDKKRIIDDYAGVLMTVQVFDYISSRGSVAPTIEGRITFAN